MTHKSALTLARAYIVWGMSDSIDNFPGTSHEVLAAIDAALSEDAAQRFADLWQEMGLHDAPKDNCPTNWELWQAARAQQGGQE